MTRMTGLDCAVICNLINTHTHIIHLPLAEPMRVPKNDYDGRAGLRGYEQLNKYTHTHSSSGDGNGDEDGNGDGIGEGGGEAKKGKKPHKK